MTAGFEAEYGPPAAVEAAIAATATAAANTEQMRAGPRTSFTLFISPPFRG
jgi:hypothetical protein